MLAKAQLLQLQPGQLKARCKPGILTGAGTIRYSVLYLAGFLCLLVGLAALSAKEAQTVKIGRFSPKKHGDKPFFVTAKSSSKLPVTIFVNGPASVDNEGRGKDARIDRDIQGLCRRRIGEEFNQTSRSEAC